MSFHSLGLGPKLLQSITDVGYTTPTPIQSAAIPPVLAGRDLIGIAQTGTGKTAAFVLPILERLAQSAPARHPRALIVAPTRELAAQIDENVRSLGKLMKIRCATIFGGVGERPQIDALRRGVDIVVATPGRLLDLMRGRHISLHAVEVAVLDEADRMLDMGFLPQIRNVVAALPRTRQTLLFSATLSKDIEKVTAEFLNNPETVEIGRRSNPADSVTQVLYPVTKSRKIDLLVHLLRDTTLDSVLIFSRTKHGADKIARKLASANIIAATIHSNRSQSQRTQALSAFKTGRCRVLVATDIASRGIDVEGISHVINFDFPMHPEDYVHRIGRTGRAQAIGDAISFVTPEDESAVRDVEKMTKKTVARKRVQGFDYTEAPALQSFRPASRPAPFARGARPAQYRDRRRA
ncbi:MAG TPA: DEAD/DEAH box helicase [Thermoanaerobaculia bacterium]|jgi:ATP-dependent RNA helicase RhlE|nr:DEAD/DEAH box helicase [Thermoanaerobaculia bacterium]